MTVTGPGGSNTVTKDVVVVEPTNGNGGNGEPKKNWFESIKKFLPFAIGGYLIMQKK